MRLTTRLLAPISALLMSTMLTHAAPASLVADRVQINGDSRLIASGDIVVAYEGTTLTAETLIFDANTDQLTIEGPIEITDGSGTRILADSATLSSDLRDGILQSARLVFAENAQLAAAEIHRADGRYTQLYKTTLSSCKICETSETPLWEIRAKRVIHDAEDQQLYFDNATLRFWDVPIFYIPRLRLPDPTLTRARGFLVPSIKSSTELGLGVSVPYFIPIGENRDVTFSPTITSNSRSLGWQYRQAYHNGRIQFDGAIGTDNLGSDGARGYVFGTGEFDLRHDFTLSFALQAASDDTYLSNYAISGTDWLETNIAIDRYKKDQAISLEFVNLESLRNNDDNRTQPTQSFDGSFEQKFALAGVSGMFDLGVSTHAHLRRSTVDGDDGRDLMRLSATAGWGNTWITGPGIVTTARAELREDQYYIYQDSSRADTQSVFTPSASLMARLPLVRGTETGATQVLEPIIQLTWSGDNDADIPNDDSQLVEFDEGNLFSTNRFGGYDVTEHGLAANLGLQFTHETREGTQYSVLLGRSLRETEVTEYSDASGLSGMQSDWLLGASIDIGASFGLQHRTLFDDDLSITKSETRFDWDRDRFDLSTNYAWLEEDADEGRDDHVSEWTVETGYQLNQHWSASADWRYDFVADRASTAGIGLRFENECVDFDLSVSRSYTSSSSVSPSTIFGVSVSLTGFGTNGTSNKSARSCGIPKV